MNAAPPITRLIASTEAGVSPWAIFTIVGVVIAIVIAVMLLGRKGLNENVFKNPITAMLEQLFLFLRNMATGIIGPHGVKYVPMLATFWLVIFVANFIGLFIDATPTADLSFNLGLAVVAWLYVQHQGISANGIFGHLKHFAGPPITGMAVPFAVGIGGLIFLIEIVSEFLKLVSLPVRLYGNIDGGHRVVVTLNDLLHFNVFGMEVAVPFGAMLVPLKLLTCLVQALVFTLLICVYLAAVTHHEDHDSHHEGETQTA